MLILFRFLFAPSFIFLFSTTLLFRFAFSHHFVNTFADIEETDEAYAVQITSDDGYIVAGCTESFENIGDWDGILIKYDRYGNVEWSTMFGGEGDDMIHGVIHTVDGGYIAVGETTSYSDGNRVFDILLVKLMGDGTYEWTKIISGGENDGGLGISKTEDEGFVLTGYTQTNAVGLESLLLAKYDADFTLEWISTLDGGVLDRGNDVVETSDGGFAVAGYTFSSGAGSSDLLLAKFMSNGTLWWAFTFGGESDDVGMEVTELYDDEASLVAVGHTISFSTGLRDMLIIKAHANGTTVFVKTLGGAANDFAEGCDSTNDTGFVVTGANDEHDDDMVILAKYTNNGTLEWAKYVGEEQDDVSYSVKQNVFGEFIMCGETENYGSVNGNENIFVILLEEDGTGCSKDWDTDEQTLTDVELVRWIENKNSYNVTYGFTFSETDVDVYYLPDPEEFSNRYCPCDPFYHGSQCDVWACFSVMINDTDSAICSDHGTCQGPDDCDCVPSDVYFGGSCNTTTCDDYESTHEDVCSGHGTCYVYDECSCDNNYYNEGAEDTEQCSIWYCHGTMMSSPFVCSENGDCLQPDYCDCDEGYDGTQCEMYSCGYDYTDDDTCSGNGHCIAPDDCECNPGFAGTHCEVNTYLYTVMAPILGVSAVGICCCFIFCFVCSIVVLSFVCVGIFVTIDLTRRYLEQKPVAPIDDRLTFVFTDIVASTELWNEYPEAMKKALEIHDRIIRKSLVKHGGFELKLVGDSFFVVFKEPIQALNWACDIQGKLLLAKWPKKLYESEYAESVYKHFGEEFDPNTKKKLLYKGLSLRMGINFGRHFQRKKNRKYKTYDYVGQTINKTSRIESICRAGYILLGEGYYRKIAGFIAKDDQKGKKRNWMIWRLKKRKLKGFLGTHRLYSVLPRSLKERADEEIKKFVNHQFKIKDEGVLEIDSGSSQEEEVEDIATPSASFKKTNDIFADGSSSSGEDDVIEKEKTLEEQEKEEWNEIVVEHQDAKEDSKVEEVSIGKEEEEEEESTTESEKSTESDVSTEEEEKENVVNKIVVEDEKVEDVDSDTDVVANDDDVKEVEVAENDAEDASKGDDEKVEESPVEDVSYVTKPKVSKPWDSDDV